MGQVWPSLLLHAHLLDSSLYTGDQMAYTQVEIVDRALIKVGANPLLTDLTNTKDRNALIMNRLYSPSLRIVLARAFWLHAFKRVVLSLAKSGESNKWSKYGLNYIYSKPTDYIKMVGWSDRNAVVRREGEYILSDSPGSESEISVHEDGVDAWVTATSYSAGGFSKIVDGSVYYCLVSHTSAAATEPGTGADWETVWQEMGADAVDGMWITLIEHALGILYIHNHVTEATWPDLFAETFSDKLALDSCYSIKQSHTKKAELKEDFKESLRIAKASEAQEQTPQTPRQDYWVNAKYSGAYSFSTQRIHFR